MPDLALKLLGRPELRNAGLPISFATKKTLALLAYLALEPTLHTRAKLAALLWPDSDDAHGRGALRYTLTQLRSGLGEGSGLVVQRDALGFDGAPNIALDVHALDRAYELVRSESKALTVDEALALADGEFLDGFLLTDSGTFEDWMQHQRMRLGRRAEVILEQLSESCEACGDLDGALRLAEKWRARASDEASHARVTHILLARGSAPIVRPRRAGGLPETPLVGRGSEFATLAARYRAAFEGCPQIVVLAGEAGIGKTRLSAEFLTWAGAQGADVQQGRAFETGGRLPYQPLVDALRPRVERENAPDDLLEDVWLTEISRLLVELRERYPDLPAPGAEDSTSRTRLFEALTRLIAAFAAHAVVVLLIDDVQWADVASLDVLRYAFKRWSDGGARVLVLLAVRSEALLTPSPLPPWVLGLERSLAVTQINLGSLAPADTQRLVHLLSDAAPTSDAFAKWLHHETGGQPFFITETLRALVEAGELRTRGDDSLELRAGLENDTSLSRVIPPGIKQVVRARLERLLPSTRTLLLAASILGQAFTFDDVRRVAELPENEALAAMDELAGSRILRESKDRNRSLYFFSHDKIRDVVYAESADARRRVFHRRACELLHEVGAPAAEIVRHALAAGLEETALSASIRAGIDATQVLAARDAILHFERAIELAARLDKRDIALEARVRKAKAGASIAQWADAVRDLEAVIATVDPAAREQRAELLVDLSEARFWSLDVPGVHRSSPEALTLARAVGRKDLEMSASGWLGGAAGADGDLGAATGNYEHAVKIAAEIGVPPPAHVLTLHALTLYWQGRLDEAFERGRAAVEVARTSKDVSLVLYSLSQLGLVLAARGQYAESWSVFDEACHYGREYGMDSLLARAMAMFAGGLLDTFDFGGAEALSQQASELSLSSGWPPAGASASIDLVFNYVRRGDVGKAEELEAKIKDAVERAAGFHGWLWRLRLKQGRAEIALARGQWSDAAARAADVAAQSLKTNRVKYRVLGLATRGDALAKLGKRDEALATLDEAQALARRLGDPALVVRVAVTRFPIAGDEVLLREVREATARMSFPDEASKDRWSRRLRDAGVPAGMDTSRS